MTEKMKISVNFEVGLMSAMAGAACEGSQKDLESNFGATLFMPHNRPGMTAYKKAPPGTTTEVADETILPVDGFETIEVDLDQSGSTTEPVKMVAVAYVPGFSRDLLSTLELVEQWGKPLTYYKTKAVFRLLGKELPVFNFYPRKRMFSATCVRRIPSQGLALVLVAKTTQAMGITTKGQ